MEASLNKLVWTERTSFLISMFVMQFVVSNIELRQAILEKNEGQY